MGTSDPITHRLPSGLLTLTFTDDRISGRRLALRAVFEAADTEETYAATFDDAAIRAMSPLFSHAPELLTGVARSRPTVRIAGTIAHVTFAFDVVGHTYPIQFDVPRTRQTSDNADIARLQDECATLRTRVHALEAKLTILLEICTHRLEADEPGDAGPLSWFRSHLSMV